MIDNAKFQMALDAYKKQFDAWWPKEKYKWQALKCFKENTWNPIQCEFYKVFEESTKAAENLHTSAKYYPKGMILAFAKADF